MSVNDWAAVISAAIALLGMFWATHRYITRGLIRDYLSELKPNGGSSIKDKVNKLETKVDVLTDMVKELIGR